MAHTTNVDAYNQGNLEGVNIAKAKNILIPDSLQGKYKDKKLIEDYHKNKVKLRKRGIL